MEFYVSIDNLLVCCKYVDVNITVKVSKFGPIQYNWHSKPLNSEDSLSNLHLLWHMTSIYNDKLRDPWHLYLLLTVGLLSWHALQLKSVTAGIWTPTLPHCSTVNVAYGNITAFPSFQNIIKQNECVIFLVL